MVGRATIDAAGEDLPWQEGLVEGIEPIAITGGIPFEQVAALQPDLIVVTYGAESESDYELLSQIAPTIATLGDSVIDPWQDIAAVAGQVVGDPVAAEELVDDVDGQVAAMAAEYPALDGANFAFANYVPDNGIMVLTDPNDGANVTFTQLGLTISPQVSDAVTTDEGRFTISLEELGLLDDADLIVMLTNGAELSDLPGLDLLPAVESGAFVHVDFVGAMALNTPTPLSVPYGLELIRPGLAAADAALSTA